MKIKELKSKEQAQAIENFYNQCSAYEMGTPVKDVIEIELDEAFSFRDTKQGSYYWANLAYNV